MASKNNRYGWVPDVPDHRDLFWKAPPPVLKALPASTDLRSQMPAVWDQGNLGSCTANATGAQVWHVDKTAPVEPSRLFIYYNTRVLHGTVNYDSGASIRNSIKSVVKYGFAPESEWAYDISKFKKKPPTKAYDSGRKEVVKQYARVVQSPAQIKARLAEGYTVNFGFTVYQSFDDDAVVKKGMMPMPKKGEAVLGGHAVLLVGYDDAMGRYIVRNSWGKSWGDKGYFYMPYDFAHANKYADDFWTVTAVV